MSDRERLGELAGRVLVGLLSNPAVVRELPSTRLIASLSAVAVSAARELITATNKTTVR